MQILALVSPVFGSEEGGFDEYLIGPHKIELSDVEPPPVLLNIRPLQKESDPGDDSTGQNKPAPAPENQLLAQRINPDELKDTDFGLTADTFQLVKMWGLVPSIKTLKSLPKHHTNPQTDQIIRRLVIRQQIDDLVLTKMFDVRKTLNLIDKQISKGQAISAKMSNKRDKAIRFNTYADIVAGGVTGIASGTLRLATAVFLAPDVVDVGEGILEGGLALLALRNENIYHRMESGVPTLLGKVIFPDHNHTNLFPESVWQYLNTTPVNSKTNLTRREEMVHRWMDSKYCLIHGGHKKAKKDRVHHISGIHKGSSPRLTIDLLEDRIAMLEDLRTEVTHMEEYVAELYQKSRDF